MTDQALTPDTPARAATRPAGTPYPWMVQSLLDRTRRTLRRAASTLKEDEHAEGALFALWFIGAITDEDHGTLQNECRFLRRRAVDRMMGRA